MNVKVVSLFEKETDPHGIYVNTTSSADNSWEMDLSPFFVGPLALYGKYRSYNMENAWQYSKLYSKHADGNGNPTDAYYKWAEEGWGNVRAMRYPMGKGNKPIYSIWDNKRYSYVAARKKIYIPLYASHVIHTKGYKLLSEIYNDLCEVNRLESRPENRGTLYLKDYDAYRHDDLGMSLTDVANNPTKKCGHAFVLMMLLTNDPILQECKLPT